MPRGETWGTGGGGGGGGGSKFFFSEIQPPPWALGRGQKFNFLNMVVWHIKFKGMSSRPGNTEKF